MQRSSSCHLIAAALSGLALLLAACAGHDTATTPSVNVQAKRSVAASASFPNYSATLPLPTGVYFGAAVNPNPTTSPPIGYVEGETESLEQTTLHRPLKLHMHYYSFSDFAPPVNTAMQNDLNADAQFGRIPVISLGCEGYTTLDNYQLNDPHITNVANYLAQFTSTNKTYVMLRFFWEFNSNLNEASPAPSSPPYPYPQATANKNGACVDYSRNQQQQVDDFKAAWSNLYNTIHPIAPNVAFVYNPNSGGAPSAQFYPGSSVVDWIGMDSYDNNAVVGPNDFSNTMQKPLYNIYSDPSYGKPILVGETGACSQNSQNDSTYIDEVYGATSPTIATSFPLIKGFMYFDSGGGNDVCTRVLDSGGLTALSTLGLQSYFGGVNRTGYATTMNPKSSNTYTINGAIPQNTLALVFLSIGLPATGQTLTPPDSTWQQVGVTMSEPGTAEQAIYEHVGTANEPTSYTFKWTTAEPYGATYATYTGVNTQKPILVTGPTKVTSSTSVYTTSAPAKVPGDYLIAFFSGYYPVTPLPSQPQNASTGPWTMATPGSQGPYANIYMFENPFGQSINSNAGITWPSPHYTVWYTLELQPGSTPS